MRFLLLLPVLLASCAKPCPPVDPIRPPAQITVQPKTPCLLPQLPDLKTSQAGSDSVTLSTADVDALGRWIEVAKLCLQ